MMHSNSRPLDRALSLCMLLALVPACDDSADFAADDDAGLEGDPADGQDRPPALGLEADLDVSEALPNYPVYTIAPPLRAQDLKVGDVPRISSEPNSRWHDLRVARWDTAWVDQEPTGPTEPDEVDWGLPVYAGIDGEVIDCWRAAPYDEAYEDVAHKLRIGGNFLTIRTADDHYVYYAHMDTNSIPSSLCPNTSPDGYLQNKTDRVDCLIAPSCITAETYLPPGQRPQVKAGQYIGRIGAHGQAAGAHLHIHVGDVVEDDNGILNTLDNPYHLAFDRTWYQPKSTPLDKAAWLEVDDFATRVDMLDSIDATLTMFWPSAKTQQATVLAYGMADYDGDGRDDLMCHSASSGSVWRDRASDFGELGGTDWSRAGGWCNGDEQRLHTGDINGDGRDDLLCHDEASGNIWVDVANGAGEFYGTNFSTGASWCNADTQQLHIGDFDGDGDDDLLCHDAVDGQRWIDRAGIGYPITSNLLHGTDEYIANPWCNGHYQRLHLGDLDGDGRVDMLCHDTRSGTLYFDYASATGSFSGTDATAGPWCNGGGQHLMVGNVITGATAELVCFDGDDGKIYVDQAPFGSTNWSSPANNWCDEAHQRVRLGDISGDGRDDLVCFDELDGRRWVDYAANPAALGGIFSGTDWSSGASGWCMAGTQGLH
ncbi:MAG: VCBS repeat domain-containing M23 family metallopeptidase [Myxococcales bacterium]|nr:VCBS repeat domain-containing M23 family metallopeptidase [Myxococcales bacterium]